MVDDMTTGTSPFDPLASYARLSERVENQGRDIVDLRSNMNTGFRNIEGAVNALATELRGSSKTQWPVIWSAVGVSFAILVAVGSQSLSPLKENLAKVESAQAGLPMAYVSRTEMDWRTQRSQEDRARMDGNIMDIRANLVPRTEFEAFKVDMQRQIDRIEHKTP